MDNHLKNLVNQFSGNKRTITIHRSPSGYEGSKQISLTKNQNSTFFFVNCIKFKEHKNLDYEKVHPVFRHDFRIAIRAESASSEQKRGIIGTGGPNSLRKKDQPEPSPEIFLDLPDRNFKIQRDHEHYDREKSI